MADSAGESLQVVTFTLGDEEYAFEVSHVQSIIRMAEITRVPRGPRLIKGVINLRGSIIPVADLRACLRLKETPYQKSTRIIFVETGEISVGFIVDSVTESREIPISCLEAAPAAVMGGEDADHILGVAQLEDRLIMLLDLGKILGLRDMKSGGSL